MCQTHNGWQCWYESACEQSINFSGSFPAHDEKGHSSRIVFVLSTLICENGSFKKDLLSRGISDMNLSALCRVATAINCDHSEKIGLVEKTIILFSLLKIFPILISK